MYVIYSKISLIFAPLILIPDGLFNDLINIHTIIWTKFDPSPIIMLHPIIWFIRNSNARVSG